MRIFLVVVVDERLRNRGLREDITFILGVCCPAVLSRCEEDLLFMEVRSFTEILVELKRITGAERSRLERSFPEFLTSYRHLASSNELLSTSWQMDLQRECGTGPAFVYLDSC